MGRTLGPETVVLVVARETGAQGERLLTLPDGALQQRECGPHGQGRCIARRVVCRDGKSR